MLRRGGGGERGEHTQPHLKIISISNSKVRERSVDEPPPVATKSLEELFKKTTAGPAIYWRPLSEEEIQAKIDEKKKKIEEVKSQK